MTRVENDRQAVELVSRSLSGDLTPEEREALRRYEAQEDGVRILHQWLAAIEHAAVEGASRELDSHEVRLNQVSKQRLKRAVDEKIAQLRWKSEKDSRYAQVADAQTLYFAHSAHSDQRREEETLPRRHCTARFTLLEEIGRGGLGTVYLARDEVLGRNVALKQMNPSAAESPQQWRRFLREAQITGHLEHPHIVPVYASGVDPQTGMPFYVMRFLGKQTLADAIDDYHARRSAGLADKLDLHRLLTAFLDVCEAIAFAHERGVLHRDLKPENVALDRFGQVVVLDWGLAKLEPDGELHARLALSGEAPDLLIDQDTVPDGLMGTPLYMAPEQAAGDRDAVDGRTDVYGLGAILYRILTGKAPNAQHVSPDNAHSNVRAMLDAIATNPPPPPRSINPHVSRDLEAICMRALSIEKANRQRSAAKLAGEVEAWIAGRKERASNYESMRMAGHDLKSRLCVQMRQVAATAKFLTELPPIQEMLAMMPTQNSPPHDQSPAASDPGTDSSRYPKHADNQEDFELWRSRLASVMISVTRHRDQVASFRFIGYDGQHVCELVHVRRGRFERSNVRSLPKSKLYSGPVTEFHQAVLSQFPGEPFFATSHSEVFGAVIECGVGVADEKTGEVRGMAIVQADVQAIAAEETDRLQQFAFIQLYDRQGQLIYSTQRPDATSASDADAIEERIGDILSQLESASEFIDPAERVYATRLTFPHQSDGITIVVFSQH